MTQEAFAATVGCSQSFIARVELGTRRLDVVELVVLSRAMKVEGVELFRRVEAATPASQKL